MTPQGSTRRNVIVGILRIARGRADGMDCFGDTPQAFLGSLAPLLAFPIVGTVFGLFTEGAVPALTAFAMYLCALLTPALASYELARRWGCADRWLRFATAFNWCEWLLPMIACAMIVPISFAIGSGLSPHAASLILLCVLASYGLWLHWFLVRRGLGLSVGRSIFMVVLVNASTAGAVTIPALIAERLA